MPSLADFTSRPFAERRFELREGLELTVRALSVAETRALFGAHPPPRVPLVKDPAKGSKAAAVPDPDAPAYRAAVGDWNTEQDVLTCAVAIGYTPDGLGSFDPAAEPEERRAWCKAAVRELKPSLNLGEVGRILEQVERLSMGELLAGAGEGNSGPAADPSGS